MTLTSTAKGYQGTVPRSPVRARTSPSGVAGPVGSAAPSAVADPLKRMRVPVAPAFDAVVFFDGELMSSDKARGLYPNPALQCSYGFFEDFRTFGGRPHLWSYHARRLQSACEMAQLNLPEWFLGRDERWLRTIVQRLLEANQLTDGLFRYTVSANPDRGPGGDNPVEHLRAVPVPDGPPSEGIALRTLITPRDTGEWIPRPNSLNYANTLRGITELRSRSSASTDDGLFLARDGGFVVETTGQNIAWVRKGCIYHPDPALGAVAGTCLAWLADQHQVLLKPSRAGLSELIESEAIFVMNSVDGLTPVGYLYGRYDETLRADPDSVHHPLVASLQQLWLDAVAATRAS